MDVIKALSKAGFYVERQKGSHILLTNGRDLWTTVPQRSPIPRGLLLTIIEDCRLSRKEFLDLL